MHQAIVSVALGITLAAAATSAPAQRSDSTHAGHRHEMAGMAGDHPGDSAFAAMQRRGKTAMGVDQYASVHRFDALADGGRIELQRPGGDSADVRTIRAHLQEIARQFATGDFSNPAFVHQRDVPGTRVMAARRAHIRYEYGELPAGGQVRIYTRDARALRAVHQFMAFQRRSHRAGGVH